MTTSLVAAGAGSSWREAFGEQVAVETAGSRSSAEHRTAYRLLEQLAEDRTWRPALMTCYRRSDRENQSEPVVSIDCLNPTGLKKRFSPDEILERIDHMARMPVRAIELFYAMQSHITQSAGVDMRLAEQCKRRLVVELGIGRTQEYLGSDSDSAS